MQEICRIIKNGNSLSVNVTKICREQGLDAGDYVLIDLTKADFTDKVKPESALTEEEAKAVVKTIFEQFGKNGLFLTQIEFYCYEVTGTPDAITKRAVNILSEQGDLKLDSSGKYWLNELDNDPIRKLFYNNRTRKINKETLYIDDRDSFDKFIKEFEIIGSVPIKNIDFDIYDWIIDHEFAVRKKDGTVLLVSNPYNKEGAEKNAKDFATKHNLNYKYIDEYSWYHKGQTRLVIFWIENIE